MSNLVKNCQFQRHSRVPGSSWKIPGKEEFFNFVMKIKFLDKIWVGKTPYMLKSAKPHQIQGIPGFLDVWIPGFKNQKMLPKVRNNITIMLQGHFFLILSKTALFCKVAYFLCKSSSRKKTKSIDELILTWKFFLAEHQSCLF